MLTVVLHYYHEEELCDSTKNIIFVCFCLVRVLDL